MRKLDIADSLVLYFLPGFDQNLIEGGAIARLEVAASPSSRQMSKRVI